MMLCYNDDHDDTIIIGYYSTPLFLQMENGNSISADKKMIGLNNIFIRVLIFLEREEDMMVCNGGDISSMSDREPDTFLLEETSL